MKATRLIKWMLLLAGVLIFVLFARNIDVQVIQFSLQSFGLGKILILLTLTVSMVLLKALRWGLLIKKIGKITMTFGFSTLSVLGGIAASSIIPGRVDLAKPLMVKTKYNLNLAPSFSALTVERVLDMLGILFMVALGMYFLPQQTLVSKQLVAVGIAVLVIGLILLAFFPKQFARLATKIIDIFPLPDTVKEKLKPFVGELFQSFVAIKNAPLLLLLMLLTSFAIGVEVIQFYYILLLLQINASVALAGFAFAASFTIGLLSSVPGGIGVTEISSAGILTALLSGPSETMKIAVLIQRMFSYYFLVLAGAVVLVVFGRSKGKSMMERLQKA
jgi:glycosyltransferase 2 family protein